MKHFFFILSAVFLLTLNAAGQVPPLDSVASSGNTTNNAIWVTGFGNYSKNVDAVGLYYHLNKGYLDALNPATGTFKPLVLRGSYIEMGVGNVGIGTTAAPLYKLTVKGPIWSNAGTGTVTSAATPNFYISGDDAGVSDFEIYANSTATYIGPYVNKPLVFVRHAGTETMRIDASGNVGIGTTNPNGNKLAVAGTVIAQKVKVTTASANWPDYVFHQEYVLPSLQEVAQYIAIHQHLPEIPSATEVEKNGLDLGEMNKQLLKKVEELTLYIIKQQKETEALKDRVKLLEKRK